MTILERTMLTLGFLVASILIAGLASKYLPGDLPIPEVVAEGQPVELSPVSAPASLPTPTEQAAIEIFPDYEAPDPMPPEPAVIPPPVIPEPSSKIPAPSWPKFNKPRRPAVAAIPATPTRDLIIRALGGGA